jgi:CRISPR system Cascade subunit CasC
MKLELHILQNFAPSNLNRDDTGSPKHCEFGGARRARISSQAIKRAIRREFQQMSLLPQERLALRSKRFVDEIAQAVIRDFGRPETEARQAVQAALAVLDILLDSGGEKTQYLLFLGREEIGKVADFTNAHWDQLLAAEKRAKKEAKSEEAKALGKSLLGSLDGGKAADLALFGRMLADLPERNIDAASQVAHAISTHRVATQFDYYTAVDDLKPEDTAGADMIGTIEFNSACYYRYSNIDLEQLTGNLQGDRELAAETVRAFLIASRDAIPTGKQNTFAAHNPPALVFAVLRDRGAWSLANAFAQPVRVREGDDLIGESVAALDRHWGELVDIYGAPHDDCFVTVLPRYEERLERLADARRANWQDFEQATMATVRRALELETPAGGA